MDATALRDELCRFPYESGEVITAALALLDSASVEREECCMMLAVLNGRYPDVLRDERVVRKLAALVHSDYIGRSEPLPAVAEHALGETVDMDECGGTDDYGLAEVEEQCLKRLGKDRRLSMSRDDVSDRTRASILRVLIRNVAFRAPSLPLGVSGLTCAILRTGDTRLLRSALEQGLIPAEEPIGQLLELAGKNTAARSLLLTHPRPSLGCEPAGTENRSFRTMSEEDAERVLHDPALRSMASDALLWKLIEQKLARARRTLSACGFQTQSHAALYALRGETEMALRLALRRQDEGAEETSIEFVWPADTPEVQMFLSLLCCASAAGQTETVRAMLDAGFDAEDREMGRPSSMQEPKKLDILALSPLLCALVWGHWDTAALLLERGASCDLTTYTVRRVFEAVHGGDVPYADIRRELGKYLEGRKLG